jgi:hypothetical protein
MLASLARIELPLTRVRDSLTPKIPSSSTWLGSNDSLPNSEIATEACFVKFLPPDFE